MAFIAVPAFADSNLNFVLLFHCGNIWYDYFAPTRTITAGALTTLIIVGFYTSSLALVADAFHYVRSVLYPHAGVSLLTANMNDQLNDLIGFIVAFAALKVHVAVTDRSCSILMRR